MGILASVLNNATSAGSSSGGSVNSGGNVANNYSFSDSSSNSHSFSRTYGSEATAKSYAEAIRADERQRKLMYETMYYNTMEAERQRQFMQENADTIYTRSVKNMIEAGINPILAASAGLSAANVGSGASASISVPSTFMGQTFPDVVSGSDSSSISHSESEGNSSGWSSGSSWNESKWGLMEAVNQIGDAATGAINAISSAGADLEDWAIKNPLVSGVINGVTGAMMGVAGNVAQAAANSVKSKSSK